jgi:hypothetical protein
LRLNAAGGLDVWLIFRNPHAESGYLTAVALVAEFPSTWTNKQVNWRRATLAMDEANKPVMIIPAGDSVRRVRVRLRLLDDKELPAPSSNLEPTICQQIITWGPSITVRLEASEGVVLLKGWGHKVPVAVESPSLRCRVLRLLP